MDQQKASELSKKMMKKQLRLSLSVACVFVLVLVGLPLVNLYLPDLAKTNIAGFSLTWLILGVLFYPLTWALSTWFVKGSEGIEHEIIREETK
ncbi:MAG: hypothetical protein JST12_04970 [Armatimonadetes bacterium]|nr:hypothetical protein [Armatimonadota bacterium]MBS1700992.1 hypothetical protein [Armatimonadota bacterium]MBS1727854.1 hypothetical protein [Armatimonadota bacterium]